MARRPANHAGAPPDPSSTTRRRRSPLDPEHTPFLALAWPRGSWVWVLLLVALSLIDVPLRRKAPAAPVDAARPEPAELHEPPAREQHTLLQPAGMSQSRAALVDTPTRERALSVDSASEEAHRTAAELVQARFLVVGARCGAPVPFATLELSIEGNAGTPAVVQLRADGAGRAVALLPPARLRVVAWSEAQAGGPLVADLGPNTPELHVELNVTAAVRGRVTDAESGLPIAGAQVAFWTFAESDCARSDGDGSFLHPRFPLGPDLQQVRVEAPGYGAAVRYLFVEADGSWGFFSDLAEEPDREGRDARPYLSIALPPALEVRGRVVNAEGEPLEGARVLAEGYARALAGVAARDMAETRTGADGAFHLAGLRRDVGHALVVSIEGYATFTSELDSESMDEHGLIALGTLVLARGRTLAGSVVDASGLPVEDAEVELVLVATTAPLALGPRDSALRLEARGRTARSDATGSFVFADAPHDAVELCVVREGRTLAREPVPWGTDRALTLVLSDGAVTLEGSVPAAPIGTPVELLSADADASTGAVLARVRLDGQRRFRFAGLRHDGRYRVRVGFEVGASTWSAEALGTPGMPLVLVPGPRATSTLALADTP